LPHCGNLLRPLPSFFGVLKMMEGPRVTSSHWSLCACRVSSRRGSRRASRTSWHISGFLLQRSLWKSLGRKPMTTTTWSPSRMLSFKLKIWLASSPRSLIFNFLLLMMKLTARLCSTQAPPL
jgi:hypothetical protein